jgi:CDP-paratose 2-epimerase
MSGTGVAASRPVLVTGGCGFIGCNLVDALASRGDHVRVLDALLRNGARENAQWLQARHRDRVAIEVADVRDRAAVDRAVQGAAGVLHLAGQVAVTTSLDDPVEDFEINARGTLNVLEAVRLLNPEAPILFASTNKVYGRLLKDGETAIVEDRYQPTPKHLREGVSEDAPLDLYSPYGCSKGAADQYARDYSRVFGLRTAVLRMSCIYGPRQFGTEDQGWLAHFMLQAMRGAPITIYGDGCQVRDALHVSDCVAAWLAAYDRIGVASGKIFNLGGGANNALSLRELLKRIASMRGEHPLTIYSAWRPGDQPWYVSDTRLLQEVLGWAPRIGLDEGLASLAAWLEERFGRKAMVEGSRG